MHHVRAARHLQGYKVLVEFEDGIKKVVDLGSHLEGPVFEPLKNPDYFRLVSFNADIETIVWPNHADFSPDFLYEIGWTAGLPRMSAAAPRKPRVMVQEQPRAIRK